ncbi:MAG: YdcF family protein [bacterium]|nr:YdcF family protein [Myxococcales bacterium]MCB9543518.1 YdcF family protein [Myxococcales bacterium]
MLSVFAMVGALVAGVVAAMARGRWRLAAAAGAAGLWALTAAALPHPAMVEKLATRLVLPAGSLWVVGYGVALMLAARGRRRAAAGVLVAWLGYAVAGSGQLGGALVAGLEAGFVPPGAELRFDAVMVLGGGTDAGPLGPQLSLAGDRLRVAAGLWHRGQAPVLVASGTSLAGLDQGAARDLGAEARAVLGELGVPAAAVVTLPGPHNTATEVAALAAHATAAGWRRVGLVTSAWHLRRAMRLAERAGLPAVAIPADARGGLSPWTAVALVPTGNGFYQVGFAAKEWLGAALGR